MHVHASSQRQHNAALPAQGISTCSTHCSSLVPFVPFVPPLRRNGSQLFHPRLDPPRNKRNNPGTIQEQPQTHCAATMEQKEQRNRLKILTPPQSPSFVCHRWQKEAWWGVLGNVCACLPAPARACARPPVHLCENPGWACDLGRSWGGALAAGFGWVGIKTLALTGLLPSSLYNQVGM